MAGKVFLVGAGPGGERGLITLRGSQLLGEADAVYYGEGIGRDLLDLVRPGAEKCFCGGSGGRQHKSAGIRRREIIGRARQGQKVVYLVPGDPMLFFRGGEEAIALAAAETDFEVVPGVAAPMATPAFAGIPVTHGGVSGTVAIVYARKESEAEREASRAKTERRPSLPATPLAESAIQEENGEEEESPEGAESPETGHQSSGPDASQEEIPFDKRDTQRLHPSLQEWRVGRGVVVRRRRIPTDGETPAAPGTPPGGFYLRDTSHVEIAEDTSPGEILGKSIEKPLLRNREAIADEEQEGEAGPPYPLPNWNALASLGGTLVVVTGKEALATAVDQLLDHGRPPDDPAAVIRWGGTNRQRTLTSPLSAVLPVASTAGIDGDCLLVVGEAVLLREELNWFEGRPLFGYRVALTDFGQRAEDQAGRLEADGAVVYRVPLLRVAPLPDAVETLLDVAGRLNEYDMIIFSSPVVARIFLEILLGEGKDPRRLTGPRITAVFPATVAELKRYQLAPDILVEEVPKRGLAEHLGLTENSRVLMPRAARARDLLPLQLREKGAQVDIVPVYDSIPDEAGVKRLRELMSDEVIDLLVHGTTVGFELLWEAMDSEERGRFIGGVAHGATGGMVARELQSKGIRPAFELQDPSPRELSAAVGTYRAVGRQKEEVAR